VFLTGKFELVFIFNRDTGEPLYGMTERAVPRSDNPAAYSWPTQPFPDTPEPIGRVGMTRNDMIRFILREWMEKNTYLPVHGLDEDGDVDGEA
jgi:hypothetical protein